MATWWRATAVLLATVGLAAGCGSSSSANGGGAGAGGSAAAGGGAAGGGAAAGSAGLPGFDAAPDSPAANPWPDSGTIDAGVFDCDGVCCDGTTHYCHIDYAGASPIFGSPPDAGLACSDAGANTHCVPLPADCTGSPSCACVGAHEQYLPSCTCDDQGGGLTVKCYYP
jgi:hypothetical protein